MPDLSFLRACRKVELAQTVFNLYALAYARGSERLLKSMSYPFSEHAERLILGETVFNFYALAYAGDCSNVRVVLSQGIQKG